MTRAPKRSRLQRVRGVRVALTDRDIELFIFVGLCGYVSLPQLVLAGIFCSLDRARKRVRLLFDAGWVRITLAASNRPNLISISSAAATAVAERHPEVAPRLRRAGAINAAGVDHHLLIVDARLFAAALGEAERTPLARFANAGGDLPRELSLPGGLDPDGVAEFATPQGPRYVAIEVDRGTEGTPVLAGKLDRYVDAVETGAVDELWIVVQGGEVRCRGIAGAVSQHGLDAVVSVLDHDAILRRPVECPARGRQGRRTVGPNSLLPARRFSHESETLERNAPSPIGGAIGHPIGQARRSEETTR